ncbi:unnamed protein product, partial [marine sediment metagenome]
STAGTAADEADGATVGGTDSTAGAALDSTADSTTAGAADTNATAALSEGAPASTAFDEAASP